jgi:hypothetical protein
VFPCCSALRACAALNWGASGFHALLNEAGNNRRQQRTAQRFVNEGAHVFITSRRQSELDRPMPPQIKM